MPMPAPPISATPAQPNDAPAPPDQANNEDQKTDEQQTAHASPAKSPRTERLPLALNTKAIETVIAAITVGCNQTEAAHAAGYEPEELKEARDHDPYLNRRIRSARNRGKAVLLSKLHRGSESSARWLLERRFPHQFGRKLEITRKRQPPSRMAMARLMADPQAIGLAVALMKQMDATGYTPQAAPGALPLYVEAEDVTIRNVPAPAGKPRPIRHPWNKGDMDKAPNYVRALAGLPPKEKPASRRGGMHETRTDVRGLPNATATQAPALGTHAQTMRPDPSTVPEPASVRKPQGDHLRDPIIRARAAEARKAAKAARRAAVMQGKTDAGRPPTNDPLEALAYPDAVAIPSQDRRGIGRTGEHGSPHGDKSPHQ